MKDRFHSCEYCEKKFSARSNLLRHQRTANLCLQLQDNPKYQNFECSFCDKSYTTKNNLTIHLLRCKKKLKYDNREKIKVIKQTNREEVGVLKEEVDTLREEISDWKSKSRVLKKQLKERDEEIVSLKIACGSSKADGKAEVYDKVCGKVLDKSTVTNTNTYIHPKLVNLPITVIQPLTPDYVREQVADDNYTFDHYLKGENGLLDFIYSISMCENKDGATEMNYVCTDASRDSYHRLIETREWEKDAGGKFVDVILDALKGRVDDYHIRLLNERKRCNTIKPKGYDPDYIFKLNNDMHTAVVCPQSKERRDLRRSLKREAGRRIGV